MRRLPRCLLTSFFSLCFSQGPGDIDEAVDLLSRCDALARAKDLAYVQAELAIENVMRLAPSDARDGLARLAYKIVSRQH